jgi:hypothetical protein
MPDIGKAAERPTNDNRQPRERRTPNSMTGGQGSAHRCCPTTPSPARTVVRAVAQASNVAPQKTKRKIAPDQPIFLDFPDSNGRHIRGRAVDQENPFSLTEQAEYSTTKDLISINQNATPDIMTCLSRRRSCQDDTFLSTIGSTIPV